MTKEFENIPRPTQETGDDLRSSKRSSKSNMDIVQQIGRQEKHALSSKAAIISFLRVLYGDHPKGYLTLWSRADKKTQWFEASEFALFADKAVQLATHADVYFGLGLRRERLDENHRGAASGVIAIPGLWIDIDVKGPAHKSVQYPATKEDAIDLVADFPLRPTIIVDSGHGLHVWWLFRELWLLDTDEERQQAQHLSANFQHALQEIATCHGWTIDNTQDLARLLRLPGTWNRKREPILVRVTEIHENRRYDQEEFHEYLSNKPERPSQRGTGTIYEGKRNSSLASIAGGMRRKGAAEEDILQELLKVNVDRCVPSPPCVVPNQPLLPLVAIMDVFTVSRY